MAVTLPQPLPGTEIPPKLPISQKFPPALIALQALPKADGKTVQALLSTTFPDATERKSFLEFYSYTVELQIMATEKMAASLKPLDNTEYRTAFQAVDWSKPEAVAKFHSQLYPYGRAIAAEPLYLGEDNRYSYYLKPQMPILGIRTDLQKNVVAHASVVEMRNVDKSAAPFRFGYCLGMLAFHPQRGPNADISHLKRVPLAVFFDVVGQGIWLVLLREWQDEMGDPLDLGPETNSWDYLPSPQNNRDLFKAARVMMADDLWRSSKPFFFDNLSDRASDTLMYPWQADASAVSKAVTAATAPSIPGGDSARGG